ncbi:hypothetical protein A4A49_33465 [Nicotiana attenuata]|uniref:DUF1985 domain-containing protein n=1 Tax=Nicotiana attenuata TaxID=49451 RepID=A0A1J6KKZ5_NICAT|nr:hypothetical protein A4A49_33465 [Nicotiana attenuata]
MGRKHSLKRGKPIHPISASSEFSIFVLDVENHSLKMAESYMKDAPGALGVEESFSASGTKAVSLGRTRLQRAEAQNTSGSALNASGSASPRITHSQSSKECKISGSQSAKEPEVVVSQNNIKPTKKRKVSESTFHQRRHSKSYPKLSASDRPKLGSDFNSEIGSNLKTKLSTTQLELFKSTCIGYLLDLPSIKLQTQLIYYLLTKEVEKGNANKMVFLVNGVKLPFGLAQFACVSGLKCTSDVQLSSEATQKNNRSIGKNMSLENEIVDNVDQKHRSSDDNFVDQPPKTSKRPCEMLIKMNTKRQRKASNVLEKKEKDGNNLKKQGKAANHLVYCRHETSKMQSMGAND